MKQYRGIAVTGVAVLVAALSFTVVSAHTEDSNTSEHSPDSSVKSSDDTLKRTMDGVKSTAHDTVKQRLEELRTQAKDAREKAKTLKDKLAGRRLQTCQSHQAAIKNILTRAAKRGEERIALFSSVTDKVETFYANKGHVLATYDQLVADVAAKKTAAQAAVAAVKVAANSEFTCSSDNPKAQVTAFRAEVKAEIAALKEYRTAVKNLIVGVKSVQPATSTTGNGA